MHILFVDESGTIPPPSKADGIQYFVLGGIVIPEDLWHRINSSFKALKEEYNIVGEIKWRYFAPNSNKYDNSLSHMNAVQKNEFRERLYELISKFESVKLICVVVDIKKAYGLKFVNNHNDLYWHAYQQIAENFQSYLYSLSLKLKMKVNGIIVCDNRQPKDDHELRHLHQKLIDDVQSVFFKNSHLVEGVFIAPSHLSVGIQFADLIGGAVFRKVMRNDSRYFDLIKPMIINSEESKTKENGIVHWPRLTTPCREIRAC